jgi:hypothetical protein
VRKSILVPRMDLILMVSRPPSRIVSWLLLGLVALFGLLLWNRSYSIRTPTVKKILWAFITLILLGYYCTRVFTLIRSKILLDLLMPVYVVLLVPSVNLLYLFSYKVLYVLKE